MAVLKYQRGNTALALLVFVGVPLLSMGACSYFDHGPCAECKPTGPNIPPPQLDKQSIDREACLRARDEILKFNGPALDSESRERLVGACWPWLSSLPTPREDRP